MLSPCAHAGKTAPAYRYWLGLFLSILFVKGGLLWADHAPMFYLGDSAAYLSTARWDWVPTDRSFLYGWVIRYVALGRASLLPLLGAQALASALAAMLVAVILRWYFAVPRAVAALMAMLCALEPLQLFYERYVMTEVFSLLAFTGFVICALAYLRRATIPRLALAQAMGVLVISLRMSFLPMVEVATLLLPLLALGVREMPPDVPENEPQTGGLLSRRGTRTVIHVLVSLLLFVMLHSAYKRYHAGLIQTQLPGAPPAYLYDDGFHLLSFVAPIAKPVDFPHPESAEEIFRTDFDLRDPRLRIRQRWSNGGLIVNLRAAYPDHLEANQLAKITAWNAVRRDPLGEARLAFFALSDYFNRDHLRLAMLTDRGSDRELPEDLLTELHDDYHLDGRPLPQLVTLTNQYYFAVWPWFMALVLLPLGSFAVIWLVPRNQRPGAALLWVFASLQIAVIAACSIEPNVRFLHAVAWLAMVTIGLGLTGVYNRFSVQVLRPAEGTDDIARLNGMRM